MPSCGNYQRPGISSKVIFLPAGHVRNFEEPERRFLENRHKELKK
jgi:hypothetical protein